MLEPTNVYWLSYHPEILSRHYWDQGLLEDMFKKGDFEHHTGIENPPEDSGGVVVINGRTHTKEEDIKKINADIKKLRWVLFIETGDEESLFPWTEIQHPCKRIWIMLPRMNQHNDVYKIPNGYRPTTREILKEVGFVSKTYDWFFAGQVNHDRRAQCVQELEFLRDSNTNPNGVLERSDGFGKEVLPYPEYLAKMAASKVVMCPSGVESPDNFRLYEALEAGCVPVVDAFSTNFQTPGFWQYLFEENPPFPIVAYWDELQTLLPTLLKEYPANANKIFAWWQMVKRSLYNKLLDDVKELSR